MIWLKNNPNFYTLYKAVDLPATTVVRILVPCNAGDGGVGAGGYFYNGGGSIDVAVFVSSPITDFGRQDTGWDVGMRNRSATPTSGFAYARCVHLP